MTHSATALADGRVLVTGGLVDNADECLGFNCLASAEVYNPATGTWTATGDMHSPRRRHSLTPLNGGLVLAVGGYDDSTGIHTSAELYDPNAGAWCTTGTSEVYGLGGR
ncbi:kelch repeat-containing protein [Cystobacter fuscus]|uniref:kelch repeat-containing protein n=1 Tax=Cystobacter fuscus TaxID=43 RepID=UPI001E321E3C|nr:kelch repeat-containing protein [Cystobacter fuscus]